MISSYQHALGCQKCLQALQGLFKVYMSHSMCKVYGSVRARARACVCGFLWDLVATKIVKISGLWVSKATAVLSHSARLQRLPASYVRDQASHSGPAACDGYSMTTSMVVTVLSAEFTAVLHIIWHCNSHCRCHCSSCQFLFLPLQSGGPVQFNPDPKAVTL